MKLFLSKNVLMSFLIGSIWFIFGAFCAGFVLGYLHDCKVMKLMESQQPEPQETKALVVSYNPDAVLLPKRTHIPPVDPYQDQKFSKKFVSFRDISEIRKDNYGTGKSKKILIFEHPGGKKIDLDILEPTVRAVLQRMPNVKTTDPIVALCIETMQTETGCGAEKWETGIKKWKNFGICQFRADTAKETLDWLKYVRSDVYEALMDLNDREHDLIWNLTYNVPFGIGLMVQYYLRMVPDLYAHIGTKVARAEVWKAAYNSPLGKGTVQCYLDRNGGK